MISAFSAIIISLIVNTLVFAEVRGKVSNLAKTTAYVHEQFDANAIACWMSNNGSIVSFIITGSSGMEWPKGSNKTIDFTSGLWLVGKTPAGEIRTAATEYSTEFQPGLIFGDGTAANPDDPDFRIYKINSDGTGDWDFWPFDQGAPALKAVNGSDSLDSEGNRIPGLIGDQTLFWVMNDLNIANHYNLFATNPMGVEVQVLVFGSNSEGPLQNTLFVQWKIINKSSTNYDSCYVALWDDPDLGEATDDLVGCDKTLGLGYCYNGNSTDGIYGLTPPALGFDFLQGPEVPIGSGNYLQMTSFTYYWSGAPYPFGDPNYATEMYNFMKGFRADGSPYIDPDGNPSKFVFNGDPVTGIGWIDSDPDDRRFLMSAGPFAFAVGDTQIIVGAKICAQSFTNLLSINDLKESDQLVQGFYNSGFVQVVASVDVSAIYESITQTRVCISTKIEQSATSVIATLTDSEDNNVGFVELFDDGSHNDGTAGDGIFANEITVTPYQMPLNINLSVETPSARYEFKKIEKISTAGPIKITKLEIVSDHLNNDGVINPGENIRVSASLQNGSSFNFSEIKIAYEFSGVVDFYDEFYQTIQNVSSETIVSGNYNPDDPGTYASFQTSQEAQEGDSIRINAILFDEFGNRWEQQLTLRVKDFEFIPGQLTPIDHVSGTGFGDFGYRIIDPDFLTGHSYEIQIIEPVDSTDVYSFDLVDINASTIILARSPLPDEYSHNIPVTEGFKLFGWNFGTATPITFQSATQTIDADPDDKGLNDFYDAIYFSYNTGLYNEWGNGVPTPSVDILQRDIEFCFTGITDTGDWFGVVTSGGSMGTQWERWAAGVPNLSGYACTPVRLPFEIWDVDNNRQINCAVINRNSDGACPYGNGVGDPNTPGMEPRWRITGRDYIIPIFTDYNPNITHSLNDPYATWFLFFGWNEVSTWTTGDVFKVVYANLLTAADLYRFTPVYTGLKEDIITIREFQLFNNYPNPFNPLTNIFYQVPKASYVTLKIFNTLGQHIKTLVDEKKMPGKYRVIWDGKNEFGDYVSSGLYFYKLDSPDFSKTRKMIFIK